MLLFLKHPRRRGHAKAVWKAGSSVRLNLNHGPVECWEKISTFNIYTSDAVPRVSGLRIALFEYREGNSWEGAELCYFKRWKLVLVFFFSKIATIGSIYLHYFDS